MRYTITALLALAVDRPSSPWLLRPSKYPAPGTGRRNAPAILRPSSRSTARAYEVNNVRIRWSTTATSSATRFLSSPVRAPYSGQRAPLSPMPPPRSTWSTVKAEGPRRHHGRLRHLHPGDPLRRRGEGFFVRKSAGPGTTILQQVRARCGQAVRRPYRQRQDFREQGYRDRPHGGLGDDKIWWEPRRLGCTANPVMTLSAATEGRPRLWRFLATTRARRSPSSTGCA